MYAKKKQSVKSQMTFRWSSIPSPHSTDGVGKIEGFGEDFGFGFGLVSL